MLSSMLRSNRFSFVVLALAALDVCHANVSLVMPGFDEQPLSVSVIGASNGETIYQVVPGQPTGTWIGQAPAFYGTATLIEGANNAMLGYVDTGLSISLVESCTLASGVANCIDAIAGQTTFTAQVPATPFLVQGGGTAAAASTPMPTGSNSLAQMTVAVHGSSGLGGSTPTKSASAGQSISPTSKAANSGMRVLPSMAIAAGTLAIVVALL